MTAKEKANELKELFIDFGKTHTRFPVVAAIDCVDQIVKELVLLQINESHDTWVVSRVNFWNDVKQELDKL